MICRIFWQNQELMIRDGKVKVNMVSQDIMWNVFSNLNLQVSELFETAIVMSFVYDQQKKVLRSGPGSENFPDYYRNLFENASMGTEWFDLAVIQKKLVIISDIHSAELWLPFLPASMQAGIRSVWIIPVFYEERLFGIFSIHHPHSMTPTRKDSQLLTWLAESAATKIYLFENKFLLRHTERRLTHVQKMAQIGFWKYDFEKREVTWSEEAFRIWGIEPQTPAMKLETVLHMIHPDDREKVKNAMDPDKASQYFDMEFRMIRTDGDERIVQYRRKVIEHTGKIFMIGTVQDITAMRKAEQQLKNSDERFRLISEHAHDIITFWSVDCQYRYVSSAVTHLLGYSPAEVVGKFIHDLSHPDDRSMIQSIVEKARRGESFSRRVRHKNGTYVWIETIIKPIRDDQGKLKLLFGISRDISERKTVEEDLRRSKNNLKYAQKIAHLGHWEWNLETDEVYWSDEVYRILGFDEGEIKPLISLIFMECVHPDDQSIVQQVIGNAQRGEAYDIEYRIIRPNGDIRIVHSLGSCECKGECNGEGKLIRLFGTLQDITVQKQTEDLLRRTEKLFTVGQLAAGLAHEIRNPLTALKGFIQLLRAKYKDGVQEYFTIMFNEVARIENITSELLVLAKPQINNCRAIDLRDVMHSVITLLETQAIMNNVQIVFAMNEEIPLIHADENQIRQVFVNIIKNAIEAMPNGGTLTIQLYLQNNQVVIQFTDEGNGIPEDKLDRLGEPFYTTKDTGTGLGIMVSQKIIADHQGHMEYASQLGIGTTVKVTLPVKSAVCHAIPVSSCET